PGGVGPSGVFDGPDPIANFISGAIPVSGGSDPALMNSSGDFVFDDGFSDVIVEGIDLTSRQTALTPEPGSLTLFATGALAAAAAMRRRSV
ncbi:MAG TPA: PEP-CTERM sorting domain-containing protein, partial [Edaphobacter sp.]|nr:PEP-CTERM sorting domain-containing protein [Edaphobacter sp.]